MNKLTFIIKKITMILLCGFIAYAVSAQEESQSTPSFYLGGGISLLGPEISFTAKGEHWEAQQGFVVWDWTGFASFVTTDPYNFYLKTTAGYVFDPLEKSKLQFSVGGNLDFCTGFLSSPMWSIGIYGKMARLFNEHLELSGETYLPLYMSWDLEGASITDVLLYGVLNSIIGTGVTCFYVKYKF